MEETDQSQAMEQTRTINRIGCIAVAILVLLVVVIAIAIIYSGLASKHKSAEGEFINLKSMLVEKMDSAFVIERYIDNKPEFTRLSAQINGLKPEAESAATLPELDKVFEEFKSLSMQMRSLVPLKYSSDQGFRNNEAGIDGTYNRYKTLREFAVGAGTKYNTALQNSVIGGLFGFKEMPMGVGPL